MCVPINLIKEVILICIAVKYCILRVQSNIYNSFPLIVLEGSGPHGGGGGNLFGTPRTQSTMKRGAPSSYPEYLKAIDKKKMEEVIYYRLLSYLYHDIVSELRLVHTERL